MTKKGTPKQIERKSKVYKEKVTLSEYKYEDNPAIEKFKEEFAANKRKRDLEELKEVYFI